MRQNVFTQLKKKRRVKFKVNLSDLEYNKAEILDHEVIAEMI